MISRIFLDNDGVVCYNIKCKIETLYNDSKDGRSNLLIEITRYSVFPIRH